MVENIISVGVDWLTAVVDPTISSTRDVFTWAEDESVMDYQKADRWRFFGYEGWYFDGVGLGTRNDSTLIQIRGARAAELFPKLPVGLRATRLDLQVTVLFAKPSPVANYTYNEARGNKPFPQMKVTLIKDDQGGGGTCYLGSRASMQYGRVYDKGDQLKLTHKGDVGRRRLWRYEVELKADRADEVYQALYHHKDDGYNHISQFVYTWFRERGVVPYFEPGGLDLEVIRVVQESMFEDPLMRKLVWLRASVSPVVRALMKAGMEAQAKEALGLSLDDYSEDELGLVSPD